MSKSTIVALILAATTTIPAASATLSDHNSDDPFSAFPESWSHVTQEEGDILAESGRYNADTRRWERCATNEYRIVCPGGYVTRWSMYEDEANQ